MSLFMVTECSGRVGYSQLSKESIVLLVEKYRGEEMRFISEQIALAKSISERYWRLLDSPDIFWDDDIMMPMAWKEKSPGRRPLGTHAIWPLWTIDDSLLWIADNGHQFLNTYHFRSPERYETYFSYGPESKVVRIDSDSFSVALLTFIDQALKGEYGKDEKHSQKRNAS